MESHRYQGLADLEAVRALARHGRLSSPLSAYWHPGEISWEYCHGRDLGSGLLDSLTPEWVAERAECHRRAFDRSTMTPEIYDALREAPGYDPALDVAVVATCEALRRLRARDMVVASVNTWAHHEGNLAFYESCGFVRGPTIDHWTREG